MKRLFIIASLAILAVGCQKTEIQNEVQTPIGFSTEVGKQTRAIVSTDFDNDQPFGVYAFAKQGGTYKNDVMSNIAISKSGDLWKATGAASYYWPNDPTTKIDFYAYSPAHKSTNLSSGLANHRVLNTDAVVGQAVDGSFPLNGYSHDNMYVDFMVATPVKNAVYTDQNGDASGTITGSVPLNFHHQMTQIVFTVKTNQAYNGPVFTVNSIVFNNVHSVANFVQDYTDDYGAWSTATPDTFDDIFPALAAKGGVADNEEAKVVTDQVVLTTIPVTMIPQELTDTEYTTEEDLVANGGQSFTITYTISGTGVAHETVVKTFEFADASTTAPLWEPNKKITYNLTIGLNEITFSPTVANWSDGAGAYYNPDNIDPNYVDPNTPSNGN